jgi:uncharacterized membrane protein
MHPIFIYLIAVPSFFLLDMIWLGVIARSFYTTQLGSLLRPDIKLVPALAFYLLFVAGLTFFAIIPALEQRSWMVAALYG